MNSKMIATGLIALMLLSLAGSVNAADVGLWMSRENNGLKNGGLNHVGFQNYEIGFEDGSTYEVDDAGTRWHSMTGGHGVYFSYPDSVFNSAPKWINITFHVQRERGIFPWFPAYKVDNFFQMTFPVADNHWICGVTSTNSKIGMKFWYDGSTKEAQNYESVHCNLDGRYAWKLFGVRWDDYAAIDKVEFPNGQDWTKTYKC
ncbi:MAG: hypothetical protein LBR15_03945 [Methanobrevibacter sp.]|jgi:hypothetical protein|nr:hypothetical protein [Candidatus Methanovirga australis]